MLNENALRVREKQASTGVYLDIIHGVELASEEVVYQHGGVVWRFGVDEYKRGRKISASGCCKKQIGLVGSCASICHLNCVWEDKLR